MDTKKVEKRPREETKKKKNKKNKKIDRVLLEISQVVADLKQKRQQIIASTDSDFKVLETGNMIVSLNSFFQKLKLKKNLPTTAVAETKSFEGCPSGSESEFEGLIEPTEIAVGNLQSNTTKDHMIQFFAGKPSSVNFKYRKNYSNFVVGAVVDFETSEEAKEALKLNGDILNGNPLYIKPNGNQRRVFFASGFDPEDTEVEMNEKIGNIFKNVGSVFKTYFPPTERFGYALVQLFDQSKENQTVKRFDCVVHKGIFVRTANLKGKFGAANLDFSF